jgi:eukaryotic-like serine/threonine-protein kinase
MTAERWEQIEKMYHAARECEASRRVTFLEEACAGDEELRQEVESLLAHEQSTEKFTEKPTLEVFAQALARDQTQWLVGRQLGAYEILSLLGAGGMGEVYRARDTRLDRDVAVKILSQHLAGDAAALARFEREAKAVAALSHPNILAIHELATDQGISYAVTELLEGESLRKHLAHQSLGWHRAVEIAIEMADGLGAAHSKGIVHRDLKPENLFVISEGRVKILDFGLARTTSRPSAPDQASTTTLTETGMLLGTVGYMSPEQVRGEQVGAASDVFSFGCVLYEMLTGRRPFARQTTAETLAAILKDDPAPLGAALQRAPRALERALSRCLAKKPEERFPSGRELSAELRRILKAADEERARLRTRLWTLAGVGVLLLVATLSMIAVRWKSGLPAEQMPTLFAVQLTANPLDNGVYTAVISPDAKYVAYADLNGLHILAVDTGETRNIRVPENFCPR